MKQKHLYLIVAVAAMIICLAIILPLLRSRTLLDTQQNKPATGTTATVQSEESASPAIEDMNGRQVEGAGSSQKEPTSLSQIYSQYPAEDRGNNMIASWARVSPEEKIKAIEQLDQQITEAKATLKINPADKKTKHVLFIAETLKKMCKSNFDLNLLETVPRDQGGLKPRSKK